jgi:hypothetical protein
MYGMAPKRQMINNFRTSCHTNQSPASTKTSAACRIAEENAAPLLDGYPVFLGFVCPEPVLANGRLSFREIKTAKDRPQTAFLAPTSKIAGSASNVSRALGSSHSEPITPAYCSSQGAPAASAAAVSSSACAAAPWCFQSLGQACGRL